MSNAEKLAYAITARMYVVDSDCREAPTAEIDEESLVQLLQQALDSCASAAREQALDEAASFCPFGCKTAAQIRALKSKPPTPDADGCHTLPNGDCVSDVKCMHTAEDNGMLLPELGDDWRIFELREKHDRLHWECVLRSRTRDDFNDVYAKGATARAAVLAAIAKAKTDGKGA